MITHIALKHLTLMNPVTGRYKNKIQSGKQKMKSPPWVEDIRTDHRRPIRPNSVALNSRSAIVSPQINGESTFHRLQHDVLPDNQSVVRSAQYVAYASESRGQIDYRKTDKASATKKALADSNRPPKA